MRWRTAILAGFAVVPGGCVVGPDPVVMPAPDWIMGVRVRPPPMPLKKTPTPFPSTRSATPGTAESASPTPTPPSTAPGA